MPHHPAATTLEDLLPQCHVERSRRGGPGGQHRNKTETGVRITHQPTGVHASAYERRSLVENQRVALKRLRVNLAIQVRQPIDPLAPPSDLWRSRCKDQRIVCSDHHLDFAPLLAEALDTLAACHHDPRAAAEALGCSTTQLLKFIRREKHAWAAVQTTRQTLGLDRLQ